MDLRDGPDRGPWIAAGGLLVNGNGRRKPLNKIDVRLIHLTEELTGIGRKALDIPTLAFGIDGVKRQRRLPGSAQPGKHDEFTPR